jgi:hypothetical protein
MSEEPVKRPVPARGLRSVRVHSRELTFQARRRRARRTVSLDLVSPSADSTAAIFAKAVASFMEFAYSFCINLQGRSPENFALWPRSSHPSLCPLRDPAPLLLRDPRRDRQHQLPGWACRADVSSM